MPRISEKVMFPASGPLCNHCAFLADVSIRAVKSTFHRTLGPADSVVFSLRSCYRSPNSFQKPYLDCQEVCWRDSQINRNP